MDAQAAPDEETIRMALTPCRDEVDEDALDALGRLAARLEAAETLEPWTVYVHSQGCETNSLVHPDASKCTCGLTAALAAGRVER